MMTARREGNSTSGGNHAWFEPRFEPCLGFDGDFLMTVGEDI
jgi:hypothetical protein